MRHLAASRASLQRGLSKEQQVAPQTQPGVRRVGAGDRAVRPTTPRPGRLRERSDAASTCSVPNLSRTYSRLRDLAGLPRDLVLYVARHECCGLLRQWLPAIMIAGFVFDGSEASRARTVIALDQIAQGANHATKG